MGRYITDDLKSSSDDFDESDKEWIKIKYHDGGLFLEKGQFMCAKWFFKAKKVNHLPLKQEGGSWKYVWYFYYLSNTLQYKKLYNTLNYLYLYNDIFI